MSRPLPLTLQLPLLLCVIVFGTSYCEDVDMNTTLGPVQGTVAKAPNYPDVNVYYGIPFARPPVGNLRFKPPMSAIPWTNKLPAKTKPNSCWLHPDDNFGNFSGAQMWNPNTRMSEDCLYLNVWTPATSTKKAIMVWIFGGGFFSGTSTLDLYDAGRLAAMNDVIVVTINYRIGPFGFLYTGLSDAPGNVGLLDQVMAIEWVYANADNMGGDRSRITLFGESAGATSVGFHMLSPLSRHLFTNGILMSASPTVPWGIEDQTTARERVRRLAGLVNCPSETDMYDDMMACLRRADPEQLVKQQWSAEENLAYLEAPIGPVVDGTFLTARPENLISRGNIKKAPIIAGVVKDEGLYWILYGFRGDFERRDPNPINATQYTRITEGLLLALGQGYQSDVVKKMTMLTYYDSVPTSQRTDNMYLNALDDISGDTLFKCPVVDFSNSFAQLGGTVYQYSFEYRVSTNPWPKYVGVAHGYEVEVFFGIPFLKPSEYNDNDRAVSLKAMRYIANFAKNGNPGADWPQYTVDRKEYLLIDSSGTSTKRDLRHRECTFWSKEVPLLLDRAEAIRQRQCPNHGHPLVPSLTAVISLALIASLSSVLHRNDIKSIAH